MMKLFKKISKVPKLLFNYERDQCEDAKPYLRNSESHVLLIVSLENLDKTNGKLFHENDWSYAWLNLVEQEYGKCDVKDASDISYEDITRKVIIISKSAINCFDVKLIKTFIDHGGQLILDQPNKQFYGNPFITNERAKAKQITFVEKRYRDLLGMPLNTFIYQSKGVGKCNIALQLDNKDAIVVDKNIVTVLFDFGLQLVSMQQGVPLENFNLEKRNDSKRFEPADLIYSQRMLDNTIPFADIMEEMIWRLTGLNGKNRVASLIVSHDEDRFGDKSLYMSEYEKDKGTSVFFIIPFSPISKEAVDRIKAVSEIGIHWDKHVTRWIDYSLKANLKFFQQIYHGELFSCRIHGLNWGKDYTQSFKILSKYVRIDSTYGSGSTKQSKGYLFGTGLPFRPLDKNGLPIDILEIPFQIQEDYFGADTDFLRQFLTDSTKYRNATVVLYHPHFNTKEWKEIFDIAKKEEINITNFKGYYALYNDLAEGEPGREKSHAKAN